MKRLAVIGAGPMGLEAALLAVERGFEVTVLEAAEVGDSLRRWGPTRFFSPLGMNLSPRARLLLGAACPPEDAILSGPEMADLVLEPLAASAPLQGRVRRGHRVLGVGRARMTRRDLPGHPLRAERPFHLLVDTADGEVVLEVDAVLDASGVYGLPAALGASGLPAPGEQSLQPRLIRDLGALHARREELAGAAVLLVGHGHSAANAIGVLEALSPQPRLTWAVRTGHRRPCVEIASDTLAERRRVVAHANDLAANPPAFLSVERRAWVEGLRPARDGIAVRIAGGRGGRFDAVVGLTGYRPNLSFLGELAIEVSPVTEGAARLYRALAGVTDCLSVPAVRPDDLRSGEPGFHLIGAKSYGRLPTFLLQSGLRQVEGVLDLVAGAA